MRVAAQPLGDRYSDQPYTWLLYSALSDAGVTIEAFTAVGVATDPPDVIHLHWPENLVRLPVARKVVRILSFLAGVAIARRRGARLVYTAHNLAPHDHSPSHFDRWFLDTFDRLVDVVLVLTASGSGEVLRSRPLLRRAEMVHTRHGHFGAAYGPPADPQTSRACFGIRAHRPVVGFVGQVRRYKGVLDLLRAAQDVDTDVLIAGRCAEPQLREQLEKAAHDDPRVHLRLGRLTNADLVAAVSACDLVVLPYSEVLNSGSVFLALSLERPVLVPDHATFREIAEEVGPGWVERFGSSLGADDIAHALSNTPKGVPDLARNEWSEVAASTLSAYRGCVVPQTAENREVSCVSSS